MSGASNGGKSLVDVRLGDFPAWKWRYIERLLAAGGHPVGQKFLRELRDRAVEHELELRDLRGER